MTGLCKGCKFWKDGDIHSLPNFKLCNHEKMVDVSEFAAESYPQILLVDGVGFSDKESYAAELWTGAEFGCIHFEGIE